MSRHPDIERIEKALQEALEVARRFQPGSEKVDHKADGDPVTEADRAVNEILLRILPQEGEGWLSEESVDKPDRLDRDRVWIVDPIDGTREFVAGIAEWCVSIGLIEGGQGVAGGIANPATGERIVGAVGTGVHYLGHRSPSNARRLDDALVLASRSEVGRGEWEKFADCPFHIIPMGSVAFKLALVAAGRADATWSLVPKHEWDIAAGAALVAASGGWGVGLDGTTVSWNQPNPLVEGFIATSAAVADDTARLLGIDAQRRSVPH